MEPIEKYYIEKNIDADDEKSIIVPEMSDKEDKSLKDKSLKDKSLKSRKAIY